MDIRGKEGPQMPVFNGACTHLSCCSAEAEKSSFKHSSLLSQHQWLSACDMKTLCPSKITEKNMLVDLSISVGICTLTGTILRVCELELMKATGLSSHLPLKWLCNSSLSASSLYHELFCINLERFLTGVGGVSFILLAVLSACCL